MTELFFGFLRVGCFAFGGAYGAIPLIRDVVLSYGWLTEEALVDMIAVSESTPGPIMVNLATYVGAVKGGLPGALLATLAVILPSLLIILLVATVLRRAIRNPQVQAALRGLKPCVIGLIIATGAALAVKQVFPEGGFDWKLLLLTAGLGALTLGWKKLRKSNIPPILLILIAAGIGILM